MNRPIYGPIIDAIRMELAVLPRVLHDDFAKELAGDLFVLDRA